MYFGFLYNEQARSQLPQIASEESRRLFALDLASSSGGGVVGKHTAKAPKAHTYNHTHTHTALLLCKQKTHTQTHGYTFARSHWQSVCLTHT